MKVRELLTTWNLKVDQSTLDRFSRGIDLAKKAMVGAVVGVAALSAAIFKLAHSAQEYIDSSEEMAQSAGVTTQFFQELAFAASFAGVSTEQLSTSLSFFQRNIHAARKGGKEASEAFRELGITQKDLKTLGSEALFVRVADALSKTEDPAKRSALAMAVLGRGGAKLIPVFEGGAEALARAGDQAREFGLVPGPEAVEAAKKMEAAVGALKGALKGLLITIGTALMPVITDLAKRILDWYQANRKVIESKLKDWLEAAAKQIGKLFDWVVKIVTSIAKWVDAQGGIVGVIEKTKAALEPFILVLEGVWLLLKVIIGLLKLFGEILGVTAAVLYLLFAEQIPAALNTVGEFFKKTWQGISDFFGGIVNGIGAMWQTMINAISTSIDFVMRKLDGAKTAVIETLNLLPGVNIGTQRIGESNAFRIPQNPLTATDAPGVTSGSRSASFSVGNVNVTVGGTSSSAGEVGVSVQRSVQEVFDRMLRQAGADMGR